MIKLAQLAFRRSIIYLIYLYLVPFDVRGVTVRGRLVFTTLAFDVKHDDLALDWVGVDGTSILSMIVPLDIEDL